MPGKQIVLKYVGGKPIHHFSRRARVLLSLISGAVYLVVLPSLRAGLGYGGTAFGLLPVAVSAILFGIWGGIISGLLAAICNTLMMIYIDQNTLEYLLHQGGIAISIATFFSGSIIGWMRDLVIQHEQQYSQQVQSLQQLARRDAILESISAAASTLMQAFHWEDHIPGLLESLGQADGLDRIGIHQKQSSPSGDHFHLLHEWISPTTACDHPVNRDDPFERWDFLLTQGDVIVGPVEDLPAPEKEFLQTQNVQSLLVIPITVGSIFWGFIEFDDCSQPRIWQATEIDGLRIASDVIGAAIFHEQTENQEVEQRALAEALSDTAAALNSILDSDEVLNRILMNVGRVLPHTAANIMLIEDSDQARIVRGLGYRELGIEDEVINLAIDYHSIPNLQRMVQDGLPRVVADTETDPIWVFDPKMSWVRSYIAAPIRIKGQTVGFINLDSTTPGFYSPVHVERLEAFANQAAIALENARLLEEARQAAITDELTGLLNWRGLHQVGQQEVERSLKNHLPLSVILLDMDCFKLINDTYDHDLGDHVLKILAERLSRNTRPTDYLGRRGGDEFVILLVETGLEEACQIAERLRVNVTAQPFLNETGLIVEATISLGVSTLEPPIQDIKLLMKLADHAMYSAKQAGRNRIST